MIPTLAIENFEDLFPKDGQLDPSKKNVLVCASQCHSHAPFYILYVQGTGKAGLKCAFCGEVFAELLLAKALIILPKGNGMG